MYFINRIIGYLNDASDFFYEIYLEVYGWIYPFWHAAGFFYSLSSIFSLLAWRFSDFGEWVEDVTDRIADILSWSSIRDLIRSWLPDLEDAIDWWVDWWANILVNLTAWWDDRLLDVQSLIDAAADWLEGVIDSLTTAVGVLQAAWDEWEVNIPSFSEMWGWFTNWWANILVNLTAWWDDRLLDIQSLIDTAFLEREAFWEGWQDWRDKVIEFFTNPFEWIKLHVIEPIVDDFNQGFDRGMKGEEK